jgi:hypothetical protein
MPYPYWANYRMTSGLQFPCPLVGGLILGDYPTMKPNDWWLVLAAVLVVTLIYVLFFTLI